MFIYTFKKLSLSICVQPTRKIGQWMDPALMLEELEAEKTDAQTGD